MLAACTANHIHAPGSRQAGGTNETHAIKTKHRVRPRNLGRRLALQQSCYAADNRDPAANACDIENQLIAWIFAAEELDRETAH
jgi:hypothetical protein